MKKRPPSYASRLFQQARDVAKNPLARVEHLPREKPANEIKQPNSPEIPAVGGHTEIYTYFTQVGGNRLLYSAESWVRVRFFLETAGPVAISTRQNILPTLSGKGILLPIDVEVTFALPKGDRIFITSNTVNRVRFIIEPIPWQEQIALMMSKLISLATNRLR